MEQITASAGSGKTYTLTRRFLEYLAEAMPDGGPSRCLLEGRSDRRGDRPAYSLAGIMAATFTNKAAAAMQAKVVRELKQQALATDGGDADFPLTPEQARHWISVILRRFDALNIRTIDSLLTLLVRLNALSLSLPPDFTPLFSLNDALLPLYDTLLDRAYSEPDGAVAALFRGSCRSLLRHHRAKGIAAGDILRSRLREVIELHLSGSPLPKKEHGEQAAAILTSLHTSMTQAAFALTALIEEESLSLNANAAKFLRNCRECRAMTVPAFAASYAKKATLDDWLNKSSKGMASADAQAAFKDLCEAYAWLTRQGPALLTTLEYMPLIALAGLLLEGLETVQQEDGLVPASRLASLALASLEMGNGVSEAFCRFGDTLVHLLFDEFQDTSTDQWRAILPLVEECLAHGGSLTYVGDVKQAIYGWRGGNAELFNAVAEDRDLTAMLPNGPERTSLPCNWRSAPPIVHTNNRIFGQLADEAFTKKLLTAMLPAATDPATFAHAVKTLTAAFSGCRQQVAPKNTGKDGYVRFTRLHERYAADLMATVQEEMRLLLQEEVLPRRSPGDVAILVRKNEEAALVSGWLAEWQIPVVTEHSFRLGNHPLIMRLVDALTFLEYPIDDAAFWSAVSGPELFAWAMPDFAALTEWLAQTRRHPGSPALFLSFRQAFPAVWERTLGPFLDQTGLLSAYDMVCELTRHCRLSARYPEHAPFLRRFAEVAYVAESKGFSSLSAFLEYWAQTGVTEQVPMPETMNAVRILSMHKAKGLEFPVVVVPFHHQADPTDMPLTIDLSSGFPLLTHRDNGSEETVRSLVEQIHLLYVAWTRPTEELYAFITQSSHSASRSALGKALECLLADTPFTDNTFAYGTRPRTAPAPALPTGEAAQRIPSDGADSTQPPGPLMSWLPRLKIFRNPLGEKGFSQRQRGLLAHACLEALCLTGDVKADIARAVTRGLRAFPIPLPDPAAVRDDMTAILSWYAAQPEAARWMRYGSPERSLMDIDGSIRRVDLLVDEPGAALLAVEYKTGEPSPGHVAQVQRYLALLAAAQRHQLARDVTGVIVYLDLREFFPVAEEGR